ADRNRSHWSTSKTPSYTKSVSWQHHQREDGYMCYLPASNVLASFLCVLLTVYRTLLLIFIDIYFYLIHSIIIF
ncbi:hypothetical protein MMB08_06100, partial [Salmonella enterica]|nr:hypothetical protein [Salmonella enterica]